MNNSPILGNITSGAKVLTGTKASLTASKHNLQNNINRINKANLGQIGIDRDKIVNKASNIIHEDVMYVPPSQMGQGARKVRNVLNPYNPKRKSDSIVDQKHRYATKQDIYPKMKVNNQIMQQRVRKVRTYIYKNGNGPIATKIQGAPAQAYQPMQ